VERVLPKYAEFLARFPTLRALAEATTAQVIQAWASLGYNLRAVRLHEIARQVVAEYDGKLPDTLDGLLRLKGIGRYTAGAVACFAYELPVATVDTNIRRVLWRVFRGIEPGAWPAGERASRDLLALAGWALPPGQAYDWQQALMDLGATTCLGRRPLCERCPLTEHCAAYAETASAALFPSGEALARMRDERHATMIAEQQEKYTAGEHRSERTKRSGAARQERFEGSSRYYRGRVVEALRALAPGEWLPLEQLGPRVREDYSAEDAEWLRALLGQLARDGLARLTKVDGVERAALP
jgi:A/G-specific adenine glycosylase